jgi:hypothetical protein
MGDNTMGMQDEAKLHEAESFSLMKWKLIVVGSLAIAGFAWCDHNAALLLLSFTGSLCAYVDAMYYRRAIAVHMAAAFERWEEQAEARNDYADFVNGVHASNRLYTFESPLIPWLSVIPAIALPAAAATRISPDMRRSLIQSPVAVLSLAVALTGLWVVGWLWRRYKEERWYFLNMGPERVERLMEIGKNRTEQAP